ncbi:MAG: hypothetical protein DMF22_10465 [Verrucomicrobia bacterium]|nr:MAG: hypothetical protein DMF22_10465 [Verrucomicrobiota bacterium]
MKIAAAQISCAPGDLQANLAKVRDFSARAKKAGAQLIVFPEMVDTGYSMPAIQKNATSWKEGAVPKLQAIAKEYCHSRSSPAFRTATGRVFTTRKCSSTCTAKSAANIVRRIWSQRLRSTSVRT